MRNAVEDTMNRIIDADPSISDADLWMTFLDLNNIDVAHATGVARYDVLVQKNQIFAAASGYVSAPGIEYPTVHDEWEAKGRLVRLLCR